MISHLARVCVAVVRLPGVSVTLSTQSTWSRRITESFTAFSSTTAQRTALRPRAPRRPITVNVRNIEPLSCVTQSDVTSRKANNTRATDNMLIGIIRIDYIASCVDRQMPWRSISYDHNRFIDCLKSVKQERLIVRKFAQFNDVIDIVRPCRTQ